LTIYVVYQIGMMCFALYCGQVYGIGEIINRLYIGYYRERHNDGKIYVRY